MKTKPRRLKSFTTEVDPQDAFKSIVEWAQQSGYTIDAMGNERLVLSDTATTISWGFFYPIFISRQSDGNTLVEVGIKGKKIQVGPIVWRNHEKCFNRIREIFLSEPQENRMIKKEEMFPMILEVCPSFKVKWQELEKEWAEEKGDAHYYQALSELADHLIYLLEIKDCETLKAVFRVVEEWHLQGEPYVREAATVGLLEDLQNTNLHQTTTPEAFIKYLLPESRKWWTKVENFWEKGEIIKED